MMTNIWPRGGKRRPVRWIAPILLFLAFRSATGCGGSDKQTYLVRIAEIPESAIELSLFIDGSVNNPCESGCSLKVYPPGSPECSDQPFSDYRPVPIDTPEHNVPVPSGELERLRITATAELPCGTVSGSYFGPTKDEETVRLTIPLTEVQNSNECKLCVTAGDGSGVITNTASGANISLSPAERLVCFAAKYPVGSVVTLKATPDAGSAFTGWSGDCSGTDTCQVTIGNSLHLTAFFVRR